MSSLQTHLDKNNLHHAYLIEGDKEIVLPEILDFLEKSGIKISGNPDLCQISINNFKVDDAFDLKAMSAERGTTDEKKFFIVLANHFTLDAEHALLKLFEEPIQDTHFFIITPDANALLKTFVSRFYFISVRQDLVTGKIDAEKFIKMSLPTRIEFIKNLLTEPEDEIIEDGVRSKALSFLNSLELVLHEKMLSKIDFDNKDKNLSFFYQILKVREYLRQPGSATKSLLESIAISVPVF
jgi:hypothetical protein